MITNISIAHSPDSDDELLFWALKHRTIPSADFGFSFAAYDTHELNQRAAEAIDDITAISAAAYPSLSASYLILPYGACYGKNYGPVVVSRKKISIADLNEMRIAIPGRSTTAASVLRLIAPKAELEEISIKPYRKVFEALEREELDAALLIHEGQLEYAHFGLHVVVDCGKWWQRETGLILPLGVNVIKKSLGAEVISRLVKLIGQSVRWGLSNRELIIPSLMKMNSARGVSSMNEDELRLYLDRYAGEDSLGLTSDGFRALEELFIRLTSFKVQNPEQLIAK